MFGKTILLATLLVLSLAKASLADDTEDGLVNLDLNLGTTAEVGGAGNPADENANIGGSQSSLPPMAPLPFPPPIVNPQAYPSAQYPPYYQQGFPNFSPPQNGRQSGYSNNQYPGGFGNPLASKPGVIQFANSNSKTGSRSGGVIQAANDASGAGTVQLANSGSNLDAANPFMQFFLGFMNGRPSVAPQQLPLPVSTQALTNNAAPQISQAAQVLGKI